MAARWIGAHMPTGKGLGHAIRQGKRIGCTAVQVFTSSPQMWKSAPPTDAKVADFRDACREMGIKHVVSHDSYLVNLCAANPEIRVKSLAGLKAEMARCAAYGIGYVVSHIGAAVGQEQEVALRSAAEGVLEVLAETPQETMLLAETTAGQGSSLNSTFEEIARLMEATGGPTRLGACLDTCHIFAAGYDIRTPEGFDQALRRWDQTVGLDRLRAIHCNDSKMPLGSRRDRHEHIGEGQIGLEAFRFLVNDERLADVPILIETPMAETEHERNVRMLWSLVQ